MSRSVLPSESCVFRLDSDFGYRQQFPVTFNDVGLSSDGSEFNGSSSVVDCGSDIKFDLTNAITLEVVFKTISVSQQAFMFKAASTSPTSYGFDMYDTNLRWFGKQSGVTKGILTCAASLNDGLAHHLVCTFDGTNWIVYADGIEIKNEVDAAILDTTATALHVGKRGDIEPFDGSIKSASVYSRALTAQEVEDRYNKLTFQFKNGTPTTTQQAYIDWEDGLTYGR